MIDQRASIGTSGVSVTRIGLGTSALGGLFEMVDEADAARTIGLAHELGIRYFDTAPLYGYGLAEERLGEAIDRLGRDGLSISTKVGRVLTPAGGRGPSGPFRTNRDLRAVFDFSAEAIRASLESSLRRLGTSTIDIAYLHDPDEHLDAALRSGYPALHELRDEGLIRAIGVGTNRADTLTVFAEETDIDVVLVAGRYTLLDQVAVEELLPTCMARGVSVVVGGVFNGGILADPRRWPTFNYRPVAHDVSARVRRLAAVCARYDVTLQAAALQFPLLHPVVTCVLSGARSPVELAENVRLLDAAVPADLWHDLRAEGLLASTTVGYA